MILAKGPRPWSIWLACAAFLTAGAYTLGHGLADLDKAQRVFSANYSGVGWNRDWTIVALSAEFTIALIPIIWIFFVARPFARWMVTAFGAWKLIGLAWPVAFWGYLGYFPPMVFVIKAVLILASLILLFTPSANSWFRQDKERGHA